MSICAGPMHPNVEVAFFILNGFEAPDDMSNDDLMAAVMQQWDGRKFDGDPSREQTARLALCEIGLAWNEGRPYPFSLIAERLREMAPELGAADITTETMRRLWLPQNSTD